MHYYKRNIGDYAKKAGRLSMLEHGAYTLLIDACYDRERFPTRDEAIEWCWARTAEEIAAVDFVLTRFFEIDEGLYVQNRIREEVAAYHENAERNSRIATEREEKRRARARSVHAASPDEHAPPPNQEPLTINQEPSTAIAVEPTRKRAAKKAPEGWQPSHEAAAWAAKACPLVNLDAETAKFCDHTFSTARSDWTATWRNWIRSAQERLEQRGGGQRQSFRERDAEVAMQRYEAITGKVHPDRQALPVKPAADVIDVTPAQLQIGGDA